MPLSSAASTTARVPARSSRRPKLLQPRPTTDTSGPRRPSERVRMSAMELRLYQSGAAGRDAHLCAERLAVELAHRSQGHRVDEVHLARVLVAADPPPRPVDQVVYAHRAGLPQRHE